MFLNSGEVWQRNGPILQTCWSESGTPSFSGQTLPCKPANLDSIITNLGSIKLKAVTT